jgi:hypothetical protein
MGERVPKTLDGDGRARARRSGDIFIPDLRTDGPG